MEKQEAVQKVIDNPMNAEAWTSLGKTCGWEDYKKRNGGDFYKDYPCDWYLIALRFHELNLTEGWDAAVKYLSEVTK